MDSDGSITVLIEQVRRGDEQVPQQLFDRYFAQLLGVAGRKLNGVPRAPRMRKTPCSSALDSFIGRARKQQFPQLKDRHNLWALLIKITECKAMNQRKRQLAEKRGGGNVISDGALSRSQPDSRSFLDGMQGPQPTAETIFQLAEECRRLFEMLDDEPLREVARMKLEGYTNGEIAQHLDVVERTIERKLRRIRNRWSEELL